MDKKAIRRDYLQKRMDLSPSQIEWSTEAILGKFREIRFESIAHMMSYFPMISRNEFDVGACELHILTLFPAAKIYWPRIDATNFSMSAHQLSDNAIFETNQYGIEEPVDGNLIGPEKLDLVFVPLVAFDRGGFRVGYGKGYYDRFLPHCKPGVMTIGFSFFEALDHIEGLDEFDVPLKFCISPTCIYEF